MRAVNRRTSPLILAGIVLMALNLRAAAASVGPMLPEIGRGLHLSHPQLALLTALPALAFACFSAIGPAMARTFGVHRAALLSLFAISIGLFARSLADEQWIFLALSTLALAGMAAAGVLLPSLVLLHFPDRLATLAAPYSRMLAIGFALAAVFTAPISHADGGWRWMHDETRIVRDASGQVQELVGYWLDITARKLAEESLRAREEIFSNIVGQAVDSIALIESFYNSGKPVAAVCHSPAVFHKVKYQGAPLVKGKRVTGFTNGEEEAVHLTKVVPFLVEDELKRVGARYEKAPDWQSFAITDGRIVTGQNPASSTAAAKALIEVLAA